MSLQKFCEQCGKPLDPGVRFCESCGKVVDSQSIESGKKSLTPPPSPPLQEKVSTSLTPAAPERTKEYLIAGGLVLVLLSLIAAYFFLVVKGQTPAPTAQNASSSSQPKESSAEPASPQEKNNAASQESEASPPVPAQGPQSSAPTENAKVTSDNKEIPVNQQSYPTVPNAIKPQEQTKIQRCNNTYTLFEIWNTGACGTTNMARGRLSEKALVTRIVFWSDTSFAQGSLKGRLKGPGVSLPISTRRGACQGQWCEEIVQLRKILPAGTYTFKANVSSLCQNSESGGIGYIRFQGCAQP